MAQPFETRKIDLAGFECRRCGHCCAELDVDLCDADMARWWTDGREDILAWVQEMVFDGKVVGFEFSINPQTGFPTARGICHFRRKVRGKDEYYCRIYETRPLACRGYPYNKELAERTGCPGFEKRGGGPDD